VWCGVCLMRTCLPQLVRFSVSPWNILAVSPSAARAQRCLTGSSSQDQRLFSAQNSPSTSISMSSISMPSISFASLSPLTSLSSATCIPLTLAELAKLSRNECFELTSVKRKRKLKMNKHLLKKRRRKMKALMRRLGKI